MKIGAEDKASGTRSWLLLPNPKLRIHGSLPPLLCKSSWIGDEISTRKISILICKIFYRERMVPCIICSRHWRLALRASGNAGRVTRDESSKTNI